MLQELKPCDIFPLKIMNRNLLWEPVHSLGKLVLYVPQWTHRNNLLDAPIPPFCGTHIKPSALQNNWKWLDCKYSKETL